jgi:AraC family transcriptional regulator, transcriptional activator of pobA
MDGSIAFWYFSMMNALRPASAARPFRVEFNRTKYGRELLIDAATIGEMPLFITDDRPHLLTFHDILLVTKGRGHVLLDGESHAVEPGVVVFSLPGQTREWRLSTRLDGACLFFTKAFLVDTFSDPRFLDRFAFFRLSRPCGTMGLGRSERRTFSEIFAAMHRELECFDRDANESLRASLYRMLVLLNRWYAGRHGELDDESLNRFVERFRRLIDRDFARRHRLSDYADRLGVSPGHLNALCRRHARSSAGAMIRARIVTEARKLLLYSDQTAAGVGENLGFVDPAYFARFFRRETGVAPARFRVMSRWPLQGRQ